MKQTQQGTLPTRPTPRLKEMTGHAQARYQLFWALFQKFPTFPNPQVTLCHICFIFAMALTPVGNYLIYLYIITSVDFKLHEGEDDLAAVNYE